MGRWGWSGAQTSGAGGTTVDAAALSSAALGAILQPRMRRLRERILDLLREDVFRHRYGESLAEERARCWARIMRLADEGLFRNTITAAEGDRVDATARYDTALTTVALLDHSVEVELGVSLGLFGTTVRRLGSKEQARRWLPDVEAFKEFGCFALTGSFCAPAPPSARWSQVRSADRRTPSPLAELGHGSNVRGIETTATYDSATETFTLRTPTESAQKYWIGGAADRSTLSTVFARLIIADVDHGIHAFVVRLRNAPGAPPLPGIHVEDCGAKAGLNGVDNGRIWFDDLRVPRADMLCGTCAVAPDGTYASDTESSDARFGAALAALTGGRVSIAINAVNAAKIGLCIAVRYARSRRAFAPAPGAQEVTLLSYTSHQRRLMIPLAAAFVYSLCGDDLREMWGVCQASGVVTKEVHVLSAGFKAHFTWYMSDALQSARECCGGQGYKSENRICVMRADRDVMLTFEGANDVMMQQVAKALLAEYARTGQVLNSGGRAAADVAGALDKSAETPASVVTSAAFLRRVLVDHEQRSVRALAARVLQRTKSGASPFAAWNAALNLASDAATAHMQRRIWDMHVGHVSRVAAAGDAASAAALLLCGEAWALATLDGSASFVRLGCLDAPQAESVHAALEAACARLAAVAHTLVDSFELPPHLLAPIAFDYVAANSRARL
jgi:acyl-CoA oxidase